MDTQPLISIVLPCYNEAAGLPRMHAALSRAAESWPGALEVVAVDDGSTDATWDALQAIRHKDPRWRLLRLSRNFGHQMAVSAGLAHARGDAVVVMDADLQDPPEVVERFIEAWEDGYEVVYGVRRARKESGWKRLAYRTFYRLLTRLAQRPIPLDSGDFCLMDRRVVDVLNQMPEKNRFVRGLRAWAGFRQTGVAYERAPRAEGDSKYSLGGLVQLAVDGIFSFSTTPLRLATYSGFLVSAVAFLGAVFTFFQGLFPEQFAAWGLRPVPGFATTVISILFIGGVQLICVGIIGEYVGRIYDEVKRRPPWIVQDDMGFDGARAAATHEGPNSHSGPRTAERGGLRGETGDAGAHARENAEGSTASSSSTSSTPSSPSTNPGNRS